MIRKILLGCGVVSSVLYVAVDILGTRRYPGYSYRDQERMSGSVPECPAPGSPERDVAVPPVSCCGSAIPRLLMLIRTPTHVVIHG